jgi:hypothetical protein
LPPFESLVFLDISYNNLSRIVHADVMRKFGHAAFFKAGDVLLLVIEDISPASASSPPLSKSGKKYKLVVLIVAITSCAAVAAVVYIR